MTQHDELIGRISGTFTSRKVRNFVLQLCQQMDVNMAYPTQLSGVGGGYVNNKMGRKKFPLLIFLLNFCLDQGNT